MKSVIIMDIQIFKKAITKKLNKLHQEMVSLEIMHVYCMYSPKGHCAKGTGEYFRKTGHACGINKKGHNFRKFKAI